MSTCACENTRLCVVLRVSTVLAVAVRTHHSQSGGVKSEDAWKFYVQVNTSHLFEA